MSLPPLPPAFKKPIGSYLMEANAIERADPLMAYFCRFYAMQQAIPLIRDAPDGTPFLEALMVKLERDKAALAAQGAALNDSKHATAFALRVFAAADRTDRAGKADKNTARAFLAAAAFLDVLQQFAALTDELVEMRKYAKFKAAGILRALREGRRPEVGGPKTAEERELEAMLAADAAEEAARTSGATSTVGSRDSYGAGRPSASPSPSVPDFGDDDVLPDAPDDSAFGDSATRNNGGAGLAPDHGNAADDNDDDLDDAAVDALLGNLPSVPPLRASDNLGDSLSSSGVARDDFNGDNSINNTDDDDDFGVGGGGGGGGGGLSMAIRPPRDIAPPKHEPPPAYGAPTAAAAASTKTALALEQQYEALLKQQQQQMMALHLSQEKQLAELRALSERQAREIASLATRNDAANKNKNNNNNNNNNGSVSTSAARHDTVTTTATANSMSSTASSSVQSSTTVSGAATTTLPLEQVDTAMAMKHARFIASALQYDDIDTALKELKIVGKLLTGANAVALDAKMPTH